MVMGNAFTFKHFSVQQDRCSMKVGTDGVLLGAWASGGRRILDIGSGTGVIALMMAQRFPEAEVEGLEIDPAAAAQAEENVAASPFAQHVTIHPVALQSFHPAAPYDAIVTNPPFFLNSLKNPDRGRAMARHADSLPFPVLFHFVAAWLAEGGEFSAIIPAEVLEPFSAEAYLSGLRLFRNVMVKTTPRKPFRRCLISFTTGVTPGASEKEEQNLLNANGSRSEWYQELTKEFYL